MDIDLESIRAEIERFGFLEEKRRPGDIDMKQIQAAVGCNYERARRIAREMTESGAYEKISIKDEQKGRRIMVLRKVVV